VRHEGNATTCVLTGAGTICVSPFMGGFLRPGDEIEFSSEFTAPVAKEVRVTRAGGRRPSELYSAPIAYVTQPRQDKRQELFLHAEVASGALGIRSIHLPAAAVRDYFYRGDRQQTWDSSPTLYELLQVPASAFPGDLGLAYKLRRLELRSSHVHPSKHRDPERAFNILMQPNLRACYDTLLRDPEAPVLFPNGGFGASHRGRNVAGRDDLLRPAHTVFPAGSASAAVPRTASPVTVDEERTAVGDNREGPRLQNASA
jgi:hypothetical protein